MPILALTSLSIRAQLEHYHAIHVGDTWPFQKKVLRTKSSTNAMHVLESVKIKIRLLPQA